MNTVYLLYGVRTYFVYGNTNHDFTLLAIYDSKEKVNEARIDWESESELYDDYIVQDWQVQ